MELEKILILSNGRVFPSKGGGPEYILTLSRELSKFYKIDVITWGNKWGSSDNYEHREQNLRIFHIEMGSTLREVGKKRLPYFIREIIAASGLEKVLDLVDKGPNPRKTMLMLSEEYDLIINVSFNSNRLRNFYSRRGTIPVVELVIETGAPDFIYNFREWNRFICRNSLLNSNLLMSFLKFWSKFITSLELKSFHSKHFICVSDSEKSLLQYKGRFKGWSILPNSLPMPDKRNEAFRKNIFCKVVTFFSGPGIAAELAFEYIKKIAVESQDVEFRVLGFNLNQTEKTKGNLPKNFTVPGFVETETFNSLLIETDIIIFPFTSANGVQTKLIKALSLGKAIISTSIICEPFRELKNGKHLIIEDNPVNFKIKLKKLLDNDEERNRLGKEALKYYNANLRNEMIMNQFYDVISPLLKRKTSD